MTMYYKSYIESVLCFSICSWYGNVNVKHRNSLNGIVHQGSKIIGIKQTGLSFSFDQFVLQKAKIIVADCTHPLFHEFKMPASLDPLQFAYRSNHSTDHAIAFTLHTALSHLENKNTYVRMLFVDYSSAFNTIVPATLVAKLQTLGLNRSLCSWILDFLTGRSQVVRIGNNTSSSLILNFF